MTDNNCWKFGWLLPIIFYLMIVKALAQDQAGESVKNFGEQIGLALLDGLLQKSQEEVARQSLQKQISLLEEINPSYAQILKQIPPEQLISTALAQRQQFTPDTGNPFLNILAKNGIVVTSNVVDKSANLNTQQQQQAGNIFQTILRNILQATQPSIVQNSLFGAQIPTQETTNPLAPNANQLLIPKGSIIPGPEVFLKTLPGGIPGVATIPPSAMGPPVNPFAPVRGTVDIDSITIPPQLLVTVDSKLPEDTENETEKPAKKTTTEEPENSSEATTSEIESSEADSREKKLEEINNRAAKVLALRKLRLGSDYSTVKPIRQQTRSPSTNKPKIIRPIKIIRDTEESSENVRANQKKSVIEKLPILQSSAENTAPPPQPLISGINSKNFAFLNHNTKTHQQFQGRTNFGDVDENGQALQVPIDGLPRVGLGRKNEDDTVLNSKLSIPKNWLSGQDLAAEGSLSRKWNNGLFGGAEFPNDQQQSFVRRRN